MVIKFEYNLFHGNLSTYSQIHNYKISKRADFAMNVFFFLIFKGNQQIVLMILKYWLKWYGEMYFYLKLLNFNIGEIHFQIFYVYYYICFFQLILQF